MREFQNASQKKIDDWGRRVHDARARLSGGSRFPDDVAPLQREEEMLFDELTLAFEELKVAEEELHVQTEELTSSQQTLELERQRYRALFEHAPVAYIVTDEHGVISDANGAAVKLLRVGKERLNGKPLVVFVAPARRRNFRTQLIGLSGKDVESGLRLRMRPRGRATRSITASVGVVREGTRIVELRWLLVDETARRKREARVKRHNAELAKSVEERTVELRAAMALQEQAARAADTARTAAERASREKSELIAIVSHELRTPLAAIGGYAELLALDIRGSLNPLQRADIERIQEAQTHILRLVDDLVGYSKLETGRLRFEIGDVIVRDAINAVVVLIRPQAAAKNITLTIGGGDGSIIARADDERLRQIVINLLSNAVKFTPSGGHVSVEWWADEAKVAVQIRDDGIGIPSEKLDAVFEPYVQLDSPRSYGSGWGLGLTISRDLARAMGGDLTVTSEPGRGAVFTLAVPRSMRIAVNGPRD